MHLVLFDWPYLGLALAALIVAWLLLERRPAGAPPHGRDPAFVLGLLGPMYLVHQFEEHGIDALGRHYAFLGELCRTLPFGADCPADPAFIFAVNPVACWLAFGLCLAYRRRQPLIAACAWGIPLVNAATHLGAAVLHQAYNPGVVTSLALFLPMTVWMLRVCLESDVLAPRQLPRIVGTGAAVHAVLIASLFAREHGLPYALLLAVNAANGLMPLAFGRAAAPLAQTVTSS